MEATVLTDKDIRRAINTLKDANARFHKKMFNHSQHKKVDMRIWGMHGCAQCITRIIKNNNMPCGKKKGKGKKK